MPSTTNRGYAYPSEYADNWYATFVALMNAIDADVHALQPGTMTSSIRIRASEPAIRLSGTETNAGDFRIMESTDALLIQRNTASQDNPTWQTMVTLSAAGDLKLNLTDTKLILVSPNGTAYKLGVDNDGAPTTVAA